jgi:hypothetical protein
MAIGSGLGGQIGFAAESTYGTYVAPTRFLFFNSESLKDQINRIPSMGIGTGRFKRSDRVKTFSAGGAGEVELEVSAKGFGLLLQHALGQNTVAQVGGTAEYTHTIIPDALAQQGKFMTVQVGRPSVDGTVRPFSYLGGKITSWELSCAIDEILKLTLGFDFRATTTAQALASASFAADNPVFIFTEGALTLDAVAKSVKSVTITGNNALDTDRRFFGTNQKKEPLANGFGEITGELECEFEDLDAYADFVSGTQAALVCTFTSPTIIPTTSNPFKLTVTIPKIQYTGEAPVIEGPEIIQQNLPFEALFDGTNPIVTIVLNTSDTAV